MTTNDILDRTTNSADITQLLTDWHDGNVNALDELTPIVNEQMHQLAAQFMQKESQNHTLQATALVNEAFIKLAGAGASVDWKNNSHFIAVAAKIMRRILVDHAKSKNSEKRKTNKNVLPFDDLIVDENRRLEDIIIINDLMEKLGEFDGRASEMLELSLFGGLSYTEIAESHNVSLSTVERDIRIAKAWINKQR